MKPDQIKKTDTGIILLRIAVFPLFAAASLVSAIAMWLRWIWNFARHGGEAIAYTDEMNRKTIQDVFEKLNNQQ